MLKAAVGTFFAISLFVAIHTKPSMAAGDGQTVRQFCMNSPSLCDFYLEGLVDGVMGSLQYLLVVGSNKIICPPPNTQTDTAIQTVKAYMAKNPKVWTQDPATIAYMALMDAYPCR